MKILLTFLLLASTLSARARVSGWCEQGGHTILVSGITSSTSTPVQASYPNCTVRVFTTGTIVNASVFSDDNGTVKSNPFQADSTGYWFFYADNGTYDIQFSAGGIQTPFTLGAVAAIDPASISGGGSGGGVESVTNDTNVTGTVSGSVLVLGWQGTVAADRLNLDVVQSVVSDTNVTGAIADQELTLGWQGTLARDRVDPLTVYTDQGNTFTVGVQDQSTVSHTLPVKTGALVDLPATCTQGELYFSTDSQAGRNIFECAATNAWTQQNGYVSGSGSPEGVVTAVAGSLYTNTSGGANTTLYVKESGSGNTGWIAK